MFRFSGDDVPGSVDMLYPLRQNWRIPYQIHSALGPPIELFPNKFVLVGQPLLAQLSGQKLPNHPVFFASSIDCHLLLLKREQPYSPLTWGELTRVVCDCPANIRFSRHARKGVVEWS